MEINGIRKKIEQLNIPKSSKEKKVAVGVGTDRVETSSIKEEFTTSELLKIVKKLIEELPEVRDDQIKLVQDRVKEGYYNKEEVREEAVRNLINFLAP